MVKLDKRDIQGIASRRFYQRHIWHIVGSLAGWCGITIGVMLAVGDRTSSSFSTPNLIIGIALYAVAIVGILLWVRACNKVIKAFVKECEENPSLSYVPSDKSEQVKQNG